MAANLSRRTLMTGLALGAVSLGLPAIAADKTRTLTLAFIPQENPEKLLGDVRKITVWLSKKTGLKVNGFVTVDYAAAIEALRNGNADISFMGSLPFVLAEKEIGAVPLLSELYRGKPSYRGRIFVRRDSGIKSLADLKGKIVAFADPISESGYLFPLDIFVKKGLIPTPKAAETFFDRIYFAGGYQQAMQAMAEGLVDAAGASQYADLLLTPAQQQQITWIGETTPIPSHLVIARKGLPADVTAAFVKAMLSLNEPANRQYLKYLYGPDGYMMADTRLMNPVRDIARRYGLLK